MGDDIGANVSWSYPLEDYFKNTGEKAHSLAMLHKRAEAVYSKRKTFIDLPVIIGSGVIAFMNAGSSSMFAGEAQMSSIALGIGSLLMGVLNSIGTYFNWARRAEGHRISALQYARLYRFLKIEMALPRAERMTPHDLLKYTRDAYDRLQEISPLLPDIVINEFKTKYNIEKYKDIARPEEANGLESITIYTADTAMTPKPIEQKPSLIIRENDHD